MQAIVVIVIGAATAGIGPTIEIDVEVLRGVLLSPSVIGRPGDAYLTTDVRDNESFREIAVRFTQQPRHFLGGPSPSR